MEPKLLTADRFVDRETGCSYRYVHKETEYFRPHYHDYYEVFLVLEGQAGHLVDGTVTDLSPGDLVFIRPRDTHDYAAVEGQPFSMLNISFTADTARSLFAYLGDGFPSQQLEMETAPPSVRLSAGEIKGFTDRMTAIRAIPEQDVPQRKTALRILLFELFTRWFSDYGSGGNHLPLWLENACAELRRTGGFVEGSERLFALTDRSREHVCRSMKKYMGMTVSEYINDLRLRSVAAMLRSSNHSIAQVVYESGFGNLSWASELFRKKYGMSMGQFRRRGEQK